NPDVDSESESADNVGQLSSLPKLSKHKSKGKRSQYIVSSDEEEEFSDDQAEAVRSDDENYNPDVDSESELAANVGQLPNLPKPAKRTSKAKRSQPICSNDDDDDDDEDPG